MFQGTSFVGVTALGGVGLALRYPLLFTSVPPKHVYEVHIQLPASMGTKNPTCSGSPSGFQSVLDFHFSTDPGCGMTMLCC